ncbi:phage portal protein [Gemmobacter denitrificans]|uniref:phage portal protein n=1 Tax=Gemmobacter denitrificans TaxID=3123040 RepID=UPI00300070FD
MTELSLSQLSGLMGWIGWGTASGQTVSPLTALDVTAVFCAARVIAEGIGQMPVRVVEDVANGDGLPRLRMRQDHWAHRLLAIKPNDWQTGYEFREGMVFNAALAGGALAIKNTVNGQVRELLPVPPGAWSIEQRSDYSLRIRVDYSDKTHGYFELDQVFYLRGPSIDGFRGLPAIRAAREAIGLSRVLERQQARLAGNGGKPSGVLSFTLPLSGEAKEKLRDTWQQRYGPDGEGGIAVLDGDAKFHSMTMTNVDAQYIETRRLQIEEIARAFRVQPIMLMQADKAATFASAEQMFRNHVIHTLGPWVARWEESCARDILSHAEGLRVDLDERNLLRGDFKDQAEYYAKALGAGGTPAWMTQNEIRAEVGLNPVDDPAANRLSAGAMNPQGGNDGSV